MKTYISILRGINVSGHKKIKMSDLRNIYESIGFKYVQTYIQSGNVVFCSKINKLSDIKTQIESAIFNAYDFNVSTQIITVEKLTKIIENSPFNSNHFDNSYIYFTFLEQAPDNSKIKEVFIFNNDREKFIIDKDVIYLYCPTGYGKTKLNNNFFENKLKVNATTRNWKTTNKLFELVREKNYE